MSYSTTFGYALTSEDTLESVETALNAAILDSGYEADDYELVVLALDDGTVQITIQYSSQVDEENVDPANLLETTGLAGQLISSDDDVLSQPSAATALHVGSFVALMTCLLAFRLQQVDCS
jgi:hypothetical protein